MGSGCLPRARQASLALHAPRQPALTRDLSVVRFVSPPGADSSTFSRGKAYGAAGAREAVELGQAARARAQRARSGSAFQARRATSPGRRPATPIQLPAPLSAPRVEALEAPTGERSPCGRRAPQEAGPRIPRPSTKLCRAATWQRVCRSASALWDRPTMRPTPAPRREPTRWVSGQSPPRPEVRDYAGRRALGDRPPWRWMLADCSTRLEAPPKALRPGGRSRPHGPAPTPTRARLSASAQAPGWGRAPLALRSSIEGPRPCCRTRAHEASRP